MQVESPAADGQLSLLTPSGYQHTSCGYCNSKPKITRQTTSASVGAITSSLQPVHYQILVDRGWRRVDASAFVSNKDQRKATNRWNKEKRHRRDRFDLNDSIHASEYRNVKKPLDVRTKKSIEPAHRFDVTLEPDKFTEEKYALFASYQRNTHGESRSEFSRHGFRRFLCSGMKQSSQNKNGQEQKLGSYHQCYRLDGRLVAMGVLDLLPTSVSSVYLIYHQDVVEWNFGKMSALREIELALNGGYRYYYMGFYIHSCIKMRYKGAFRPTYVLDPETYTWDLLNSDMFQRMSARKYVSMTRERQFSLPAIANSFLQSDRVTSFDFSHELELGLDTFRWLTEYVGVSTSGESTNLESFSSVFEAGTPGVMTMEEVEEEIDLDSWGLKLGDRIVALENLVTWEDSEMSDSSTIKGVAAELAACIGPDLVRQTMLQFD